ncbi:MAG TPA: O-antigen ligase family protein [Tepidisphaeraceae bacterium]|jgi:O-antigen ligase|nr:O-antigen ligase family protein [Tepidisphaeraceae bacterium]
MSDHFIPYTLTAVAGLLLFAVSLRFRDLPLILLFVMLPFPKPIGGETSAGNLCPADVMALLALAALLVHQPTLRFGPAGLPLLLFFIVCITSSILNPTAFPWLALVRMVLATGIASLLFAGPHLKLATFHRCMVAYLIGCGVLAGLSVITFLTSGIRASMSTLDLNKNALGPIFGCGVVVAMAYRLVYPLERKARMQVTFCLIACVIGQTLTLSRGSWIATAGALLLLLLLTGRIQTFVLGLILTVPLIFAIWSVLPEEAAEYATNVSSDAYVIRTRLDAIDIALNVFQHNPIFGVGLGLRRIVEPHNVLISTLGETGVVGLAGFLGICISAGYTFWRAAGATKGDARSSALVFAGAAVFFVSTVHGLMDVYWRRGVGFMGWACVGMAVHLIQRARTVPRKTTQAAAGDKVIPPVRRPAVRLGTSHARPPFA